MAKFTCFPSAPSSVAIMGSTTEQEGTNRHLVETSNIPYEVSGRKGVWLRSFRTVGLFRF